MQRILPPMEEGGRFFLNLALTTPLVPCTRVTLPHDVRKTEPFFLVLALYT